MPSELTFNATESFRRKLLVRNLPPYKEGYKGDEKPGEFEFSVNDVGVIDSGNVQDIGDIQENKLYVKNKYGPEDSRGFGDTVNINNDNQTESNYGEYEYFSSEPSIDTETSQRRAEIKNQYLPEEGYTKLINIEDIERIIESRGNYYTFIFSTYNPGSILNDLNPLGSNGNLSQDSDLAKIGAESLKSEFLNRIAFETRQQTLGRVNAFDALSDPFDALAIVTGNRSVIEKDYHISVPENIIGKGLDFISRVTGVYSPYSWIAGDYFTPETKQTSEEQATRGGLFSKRDKLKTQANKRASDLMLKSTGKGQSGRLFSNLSYNKFRPDYQETNSKAPVGDYYLGSKILSVQDIISPPDALPVDDRGNKVDIPVRGYGELGTLYENKEASNNFSFGLNGSKFIPGTEIYTNSSYDSKRLQGGFAWITDESSKGAKKAPTRGGGVNGQVQTQGDVNDLLGSLSNYGSTTNVDNGYDSTPKSSSYNFTKGSILDNTQKIILASDALQGPKKLQHVGNAINQISKVFNDGTREMTKGSMVYKYEDLSSGRIVGTEYCRVFSKDRTYSHNKDLQKDKGAVNDYRKFSNSVLDNTYNLNIAPMRGESSTNIKDGSVKKYMFSIENLAWRTSNKKGYTYQDLAVCERGPNKGRIMWFPPYDLKVSETNSVNWTTNEFLGRPEPIYTYNNTMRQGTLSWKIIVDHPSILNVIVDKELKNKTKSEINDIVDSFFAGCRDYDMYDLATRFPQFTMSDIYEILSETQNVETAYTYMEEIPRVDVIETTPVIEDYVKKTEPEDYSFFYYFHHDVPGPKNATATNPDKPYSESLSDYLGLRSKYEERCKDSYKEESLFFIDNFVTEIENNTIELLNKIKEAVNEKAKINIVIYGSASAPASETYNSALSKRRINSVREYLENIKFDSENNTLKKYIDEGYVTITESPQGENAEVYTPDGAGPYDCTENFADVTDSIYTPTAMACRRCRIDVQETPPSPEDRKPEPTYEEIVTFEEIERTGYTSNQVVSSSAATRNDVAKRILRRLLSECDYFDILKEDSPLVYEGIQDKIKFFQPSFHSMTPEGLNSRLTFLQQCLRPGDTIPVIGPDGKPKKGGIQNTAFGAPPICILRIGDFYHTKIAINQMSVSFDPLILDLNPEGIGVQPMIADISMSFYFIGGQGLQEPVTRLQNALSFNYYGNTEMYDDRAVPTEDRDEVNNEVMRKIEEIQGFSVKDGEVERPEEAGDTIGEIISTDLDIENNTVTGQIKYKEPVKELVKKSETYAQGMTSTLEEISKSNSLIGLYYFSKNTKYFYGEMTGYLDGNDEFPMNIFGKPEQIQNEMSTLSTNLISDVDNNLNPFLKDIEQFDFKSTDKKKFRRNLKTFINNAVLEVEDSLNSQIGLLVDNQLNLVRIIDKINLIHTKTDGFRNKSGKNILFDLSGTTDVDVSSTQSNTVDELTYDVQTVGIDLTNFYMKITSDSDDSLVNNTKDNFYEGFLTGDFDTEPQTRFCTVAYSHIINDPEGFANQILGEELKEKPEWVSYVNKIIYGVDAVTIDIGVGAMFEDGTNTIEVLSPDVPGLLDEYNKLKTETSKKVNTFKNDNSVKKFTLYDPFNLDKERVFDYVQENDSTFNSTKNDYFNKVYEGINGGDLNKFNQKYTFN